MEHSVSSGTFFLGEPYLTAGSGPVNNAFVNQYRGRKQTASQKKEKGHKTMRKIFAVIFGLSLATAGLSIAAQAPAPAATPAGNNAAATTTTRKHVKKNKKAAKPAETAATPATPAPAATK